MSFTDKAKLTALAIVHVFETSRPFGGYDAVAVLNDGAGVSYGVSQFTHRSGSLRKVVNTYLGMGGSVGAAVLRDRMHLLIDTSPRAIQTLSNDRQFKDALKFAAETDEMKLAQNQIAENFYLLPAIAACEGSNFVLPLSLAVVYDSMNHGSWPAIRDRVQSSDADEKRWITEYVRRRHEWLRSKPKLKATSYRTHFFLDEIADGNWQLELPVYPHGTEISDEMIVADDEVAGGTGEADRSVRVPLEDSPAASIDEGPAVSDTPPAPRNADEAAMSKPADDQPGEQQPATNAAGFTAEKFTAYVPQIDTARAWIKRALAGSMLGTGASVYFGLPVWIQATLAGVIVLIVAGAIVVFVKYHDKVFAFITEMNKLRADNSMHNPEISADTPTSS